jgi:hypothetical protein
VGFAKTTQVIVCLRHCVGFSGLERTEGLMFIHCTLDQSDRGIEHPAKKWDVVLRGAPWQDESNRKDGSLLDS